MRNRAMAFVLVACAGQAEGYGSAPAPPADVAAAQGAEKHVEDLRATIRYWRAVRDIKAIKGLKRSEDYRSRLGRYHDVELDAFCANHRRMVAILRVLQERDELLGGIGRESACETDEDVERPVLLRDGELRYPAQAARSGASGSVLVEFVVVRDGSVEDVRVLSSEPLGVFDAAAIDAVRNAAYEPVEDPVRTYRRIVFSMTAE